MERFIALISAVVDTFVTKSRGAAERLAPHAGAYLRLLSRLVILALIPPCLFVPLVFFGGTARDVGVLTIAILWSILTLLLTLAISPLGLVIDALRGGVSGVGERYVRFAGNVLFAEYSLAFLLLVIPLRNNLAGIPLLFVTFTLLMLGGVFSKRLMTRFAFVVLPILLLSFFSPKIYSALNSWFGAVEERVAEGVTGGGGKPTNDGPPVVGSGTAQEEQLLPRVQEFTLEDEELSPPIIIPPRTIFNLGTDTQFEKMRVFEDGRWQEWDRETLLRRFRAFQEQRTPLPSTFRLYGPGTFTVELISSY